MNRLTLCNVSAIGLAALFAMSAGTACTDVGDNSASSGSDSAALDGMGSEDATTSDEGDAPSTQNGDASGDGDTAVGQPDATATADATIDHATPAEADADATVTGGDAGADVALVPESGVDAPVDTGVDAPVDTGVDAPVDTGVDAPVDTGADAPVDTGADAPVDTGTGGGASVPCTTVGQTGCVQCNQNTNGVCTGTEAVLLMRDIEKGYVTGNLPTAATSCYSCLASLTCIDSKTTTQAECEDLKGFVNGSTTYTLAQACLDTLNCVLGYPQSGTAGTGGTRNQSPTAACSNDPPPGDGVANCFCGSAETDVADCEQGDKISAMTPPSAGLGSASPNGVCDSVILTALGLTTSASNTNIITQLGDSTDGPGQAFLIANCGGSTSDPIACPTCFE